MSDLDDLYQEVILDHNRSPRNYRELPPPALHREGYNPLCGDKIEVFVSLEGDAISDVSFKGAGCAISQASASVMTTVLKGKTKKEAEAIFQSFQDLVTGEGEGADLGDLQALGGVRDFPTRVKCATLAWHAVAAAISNSPEPSTSTE